MNVEAVVMSAIDEAAALLPVLAGEGLQMAMNRLHTRSTSNADVRDGD